MHIKVGDSVIHVAGVVAMLKKAKIPNHIQALTDTELLYEKLSIMPIGNDKFVKVVTRDLDKDEYVEYSNSVNTHKRHIKLIEDYAELSHALSFVPIVNHDYGLFKLQLRVQIPADF